MYVKVGALWVTLVVGLGQIVVPLVGLWRFNRQLNERRREVDARADVGSGGLRVRRLRAAAGSRFRGRGAGVRCRLRGGGVDVLELQAEEECRLADLDDMLRRKLAEGRPPGD